MKRWRWALPVLMTGIAGLAAVGTVRANPSVPPSTPEAVLRESVLANERRDLEGMAQLFLKDSDIVSYGIKGLKFVGWTPLEQILRSEFQSVSRLEIAIKDLKVWTRGEVAWFVMELDYTRVLPGPNGETRMLLKLRETGVLEKRDGRWLFHSWHESTR
jgi:uncharacterized protein (TIGR02246 family)